MNKPVSIIGAATTSGLGSNLQEHASNIEAGITGLQPLTNFTPGAPENLQAAWIQDRSLLISRKWAPASTLALHCAKEAIADAQLSPSDLKHAAIIAGSSRGNAYLTDWPNRRPFKLMAASNSMHGEIASAVSIELGITGPWQVISSGCAASLDAIGYAKMLLNANIVKHAIVLGIELPLVPEIIETYQSTGVLNTNGINDPYHPETSGFFPGEAGCALILTSEPTSNTPTIDSYHCNSDADSPIGMPTDGHGLKQLIQNSNLPEIHHICPHASGTHLHSKAENTALINSSITNHPSTISLHPLKPFTGHTVGASGALDTTILTHYLRKQQLPPNLPNLSTPSEKFTLPNTPIKAKGTILKIAVGMGGHNSMITLKPPQIPV